MKKLFEISIAAFALILLSAACAKVNPVDETPVSQTVTIRATISDAATRVTFDPSFDSNSNPTAMAHTWQAGDKLRITDASDATKTALFDLVEGEGTATGTFRGEGSKRPAIMWKRYRRGVSPTVSRRPRPRTARPTICSSSRPLRA